MIKNNKVINSILLPRVLSLTFLISLVSGASIYVSHEKLSETVHTEKRDICLLCLVAMLIICACADVYSDYNKSTKISSLVARKYLKKEMEEHPEFKQFEKVLTNPQAMQNISALIFNSLHPSESERVVQMVFEMRQKLRDYRKYGTEDTESSKDARILLNDTRNKIVTIIQEHASVHPEFIRDIYSAVARADMIYIMSKNPIQQHSK